MFKTVFTLTAIMPEEHPDSEVVGEYDMDEYGCINTSESDIGIYSSVKEAEHAIADLIRINKKKNKRWHSWTEYFCFFVTEQQLNGKADRYGNFPQFESVRSYLSDGTLNCISDYDSSCKKKFTGRKQAISVKSGCMAYYYSHNGKLVPILLESAPYTKTEWKKRFKPGAKGDYSDDSGLAFPPDGGHDHPMAVDIFPVINLKYWTIPDKVITEILKAKHEYYNPPVLS